MTACIYLTIGLLLIVGAVCELLGSAIKWDSIQRDQKFLWTQYNVTLEDMNYTEKR